MRGGERRGRGSNGGLIEGEEGNEGGESRFKDALNGCVGVLPTLLTVSLPPP